VTQELFLLELFKVPRSKFLQFHLIATTKQMNRTKKPEFYVLVAEFNHIETLMETNLALFVFGILGKTSQALL
jgi:hypothetical protein